MNYHGLLINSGYMEGCNNEYADQLCLYGWLLGEAVGDENVVLMIDEIVAKYMGPDVRPLLRVANHRGRVSKAHQERPREAGRPVLDRHYQRPCLYRHDPRGKSVPL